jgi:cystathionine gamma-lyase
MNFKTLAIHAGHNPQEHYGAVMPPIYQNATFAFRDVGKPGPYEYSRTGNPTRRALESCLAQLENGTAGFAFATGMAAETTALMLFSAGDHILVQGDLYGGTYRLFEKVFASKQIRAQYINLRDSFALREALATRPKALWIETPSNPLMTVVDIRAVSDLARKFGALVICDNTFLSP